MDATDKLIGYYGGRLTIEFTSSGILRVVRVTQADMGPE
jgi:hypothetical protein